MRINIIGNGSAGLRHRRMLEARGHTCTLLGPASASPATHPGADAVVIASPPQTHKLYLGYYHDKAHILCEGPVTWLPHTAHNFAQMTASNWRFVGFLQNLRSKCLLGARPVHAQLWFDYALEQWRKDWDYRTSCYYTDGLDWINVHEVDLALWLLGIADDSSVWKSYRGKSLGCDAFAVSMVHESSALSTISCSWYANHYSRGVRVFFSDGSQDMLEFTSPLSDALVNQSYEDMVDAWIEGCGDALGALPAHAASLADGYRAFRILHPGG